MAYSYTVQYDALGRAYLDQPGARTYISPVAMGKAAPTDTTGIFQHAPRFNPKTGGWETPTDWGNIGNIAAITALTAGAASAVNAAHAAPVLGSTAPNVIEGAGVAGIEGGLGVGAGVGAGAGAAAMGWGEIAAKYGLPAVGNTIDTLLTTGANADALRIEQEYRDKALAAALEEQAYERKRLEEQTAYDRLHGEENTAYTRQHAAELLGINQAGFGNYLSQLAPYRNAGTTALERMQAALAGSPWQPNNGVTRSFL